MNETRSVNVLINKKLINAEQLASFTQAEVGHLLQHDLWLLIQSDEITPEQFSLILSIPRQIREIVVGNQGLLNLICNDLLTVRHVNALNGCNSLFHEEWRWLVNSPVADQWLIDGILQPEHIPLLHELSSFTEGHRKIESYITLRYLKLEDLKYFRVTALRALICCEDLLESGHLNERYFPFMQDDNFSYQFTRSNPSLDNMKELMKLNLITPEIIQWSAEYYYYPFKYQCSIFSNFFTDMIKKQKLSFEWFLDKPASSVRKMLQNHWTKTMLEAGLISVPEIKTLIDDFDKPPLNTSYVKELPHMLNELPSVQKKIAEIFKEKPDLILRFMLCVSSMTKPQSLVVDTNLFLELILSPHAELREAVDSHFLTTTEWFTIFLTQGCEYRYTALQRQLIPQAKREGGQSVPDSFSFFGGSIVNEAFLNHRYESLRKPYQSIFRKESVHDALEQLKHIIDINRIVSDYLILKKQLDEDVITVIESHRLKNFSLEVRMMFVNAVISFYKLCTKTQGEGNQTYELSYSQLITNLSVYESHMKELSEWRKQERNRERQNQEQMNQFYRIGNF